MPDNDLAAKLSGVIQQANQSGEALRIVGGNTKAFYGRRCQGQALSTTEHSGVINYDPTELVITARSGTRLTELENVLAEQNQKLPFEPPHFGEAATLGGTIACGLSGPRRPYTGSARDLVLGIRCITGRGEHLQFGGQVIKNVAGYDVSRLMTGALGTLGLITEVSLKVLPKPETEITLQFAMEQQPAIDRMNELAGQPVPLSAACWYDGVMRLRLSGTEQGVRAAQQKVGGELNDEGDKFWMQLREQTLPFFENDAPLWRLSVPPATKVQELDENVLHDWGGAQRWLFSSEDPSKIRETVTQNDGHATCFRNHGDIDDVFHPIPEAIMQLHRNLKQSFDPKGILNPGRMYGDL
ncbi:MAG: glycolate oxidase subunit GlcE [Gammaproteobacteria bacterium]|nr:glycolate oxidase subunit GlcE [Gammaproteobacteria bacterium]